MRKTKILLLTSLIIPFLISCGEQPSPLPKKSNDDDLTFTKQSFNFVNLTDEYKITTPSFDLFFCGSSDVPYISSTDFILGLDGLFDCGSKMASYKNGTNQIIYAYSYSDSDIYSMTIDWYENRISFSSVDFPAVIAKDTGSTDYSAHFKYLEGYGTSDNAVNFNVGAYYFDIYNYQNTCLVPLSIFNILLGSPNYYNLIFNGEKIYGYFGEISSTDKEYTQIYTSKYNGTTASEDMRKASYYSMCFAIDYFYGLKKYQGFTSYDSFISTNSKNKILSKNANENMNGYFEALVTQIDELHTRLDSGSIYNRVSEVPSYTYQNIGQRWSTFYSTRNTLNQYINNRWSSEGEPVVRFVNKTAIVNLKSFLTAPNSELYDEKGNLKPDAWEKDTYWYLHHVYDEIESQGNIKNVIFDLASNGGGNVGALLRAIGFLTNQNIRYTIYNTLADRTQMYYYAVDVDNDNDYTDMDAFTQYKYFALSSGSTYSAANTFVSMFQELKIGKTIGQTSGGGMCSVLPIVLADGTFFAMSSSGTIRQYINGNTLSIEEGLEADIEIDYSKFYDDQYLDNIVSNN